jgi:hypothetical protein
MTPFDFAKSAKRGRSVSMGAAFVLTWLTSVSPSVAGPAVTHPDPLFTEQAQAQDATSSVPTEIYQTVYYYGGGACSSAQADTDERSSALHLGGEKQ